MKTPLLKALKMLISTAALSGAFGFFSGCAREDAQLRQLTLQQAATIESLNAEIVRLNEEVNQRIYARETLQRTESAVSK